MLPGPPLLSRSVDKWVENHIQVQLQQTFLDIDVHAVGNPALVPGAPKIGWLERNLYLWLDSSFHSTLPFGMPVPNTGELIIIVEMHSDELNA
jgi:hypothetical protein